MELTIRRRDVYITILLLLVLGSLAAFAVYDNTVMHAELKALAQEKIEAWFSESNPPVDRSKYDYLAIVDSKKAFTLFGRGWGIIHVYYREKGDEDFKTFKGLEYFYRRDKGKWVMTDSAGCGAFEHHIRAFNEFLSTGVDVPDRVFDRALGIDFAYDRKKGFEHDHEQGHDHGHEHDHGDAPINSEQKSS